MASKSFGWTLIKKPFRKYGWREGQDTPVKWPLSVPRALLDALDLFFNQCRIGWSWTSRPFPHKSSPPPSSIASVFAKILLKYTILDTSQYILHLMNPSINKITGGGRLDATISIFPHTVLFLLATSLRAVWVYGQLELSYHVAMLIGRILLRQTAQQWPPFLRRPWMATSLRGLWGLRWHQFFQHLFGVFGARPGSVLPRQPGAAMGAFVASLLLHIVGRWETGRMTELIQYGGFFVLIGFGVVLEGAFERATGSRVRGFFGWLWTMAWTLLWGALSFDGASRRGIFAVELFPDHLRPGKMLVDGAISLVSKCN
jgi:hypothetical protein